MLHRSLFGPPSTGMSVTVELAGHLVSQDVLRASRTGDEPKDDHPPRVDLHTPVDYSDMPPLEDEDNSMRH